MVRRIVIYHFVIFALLISRAYAVDLSPEQEARAQHIDSQVFSPFCPGRLLEDCPSGLAKELRDKIRGQIAAGESDQQIIASLTQRFGEQLLAAPTASDAMGWVAWLAPAGFLLVGITTLVAWIRARKQQSDDSLAKVDDQSISDSEVERVVRQELHEDSLR